MASVKPKKHLGQHFLEEENIAKKMVGSLKSEEYKVIEIGPGTGALTKYLLERFGKRAIALDVDVDSVEFLKKTYSKHKDQFLLQDFLDYDMFDEKHTVIGNFPYNISSQLFFKIWENRNKVDEVVCMVQKEVADRIYAKHGSKTYGILSVFLQSFYSIEYLFTVPPHVFTPPPKVQSATIRLKRNETIELECDEVLFKRVVKAGFGKRRKTLRNALKEINLPESMDGMKVLGLRAEQLSVSDFISLTAKISSEWNR